MVLPLFVESRDSKTAVPRGYNPNRSEGSAFAVIVALRPQSMWINGCRLG
jgi:hypothetical protein